MASGEAEVGRGKGDADAPAQPLGDLAATDLIDVCIQQVHLARITYTHVRVPGTRSS